MLRLLLDMDKLAHGILRSMGMNDSSVGISLALGRGNSIVYDGGSISSLTTKITCKKIWKQLLK